MNNKTTWRRKYIPKPKPTRQHNLIFRVMAMTEEELAAVVAGAKHSTLAPVECQPTTEEQQEGSTDEQ